MMLIDTTKLDPTKTYVGLEISTSQIAGTIKSLQHGKYPEFNKEDISSHALALICREDGWKVWENHLKWGGIREYSLEEYEWDNASGSFKRVLVYEYPLNLDALDYWKKNNPGYSVLNLFAVASERLLGLKMPDTKGWICSQAIAACGFDVCNKMGIQFDDTCPVDFQRYFA